MTREQLRVRHQEAIRRWARVLIDRDGSPPDGLLDELQAIADGHAEEKVAIDRRTRPASRSAKSRG